MATKISKAQLEVWEWKEKAYGEIKNMSQEEMITFIKNQTKDMVEQMKSKRASKK